MLLAVALGAVALPYATLWLSRSARVRSVARRLDRTGWPSRLALVAAALSIAALGLAGSAFVTFPVAPAWAFVTLALFGYAHVELFVAADELRRYPDERALHFALDAPATWPSTAMRIYSTWTYLVRTRHPWLALAYLACAALWGVAPYVGLPPAAAVVLASDSLVLSLACTHGALADHREPRARLEPRLDGT
ncbi:hypothetical protein ACFQPA_08245 [Halomarina halobia]|uniref:DUF3267 domain-containing protein n=1 Tax=Halomarina halobia TaxID=3033386 RepID=A0ABD6AC88_9EURY|nr:hypothetical protein [Halomarina sp. PSR21]